MSIRTNYEKWYEGEEYYWGLEPGSFLDELIDLCPPAENRRVLDIGCGEGKDAVYLAQKGYDVTAFDLTENGIKKTMALAKNRGVKINAYVDDINTLILQDADNLDAIGAIGIGRTFSYSGSHKVVMYDDSIPLNEENDYSEANGNDPSTIHHFYHKLFKLGNNMNTKTAREMANRRTEIMKDFVKEFLNEWNANY